MTYIKKEDVQKILDSNQKIYETKDYKESIEEEINSLPSINPESMIEEMIQKGEFYWFDSTKYIDPEELLQKFKS